MEAHLTKLPIGRAAWSCAALALLTVPALAQDADELAKAVANPLANMISVPLQGNVDFGQGANNDGQDYSLKIQPVIPFALNKDWNVISRTILPISFAHNIFPNDVGGLGDLTQSFFLSPSGKNPYGITWGIGPEFLIPTATDRDLGGGKWGVGPTGLVLLQQDKWTVGMLASQTWSVAGDSSRSDISELFLQPFVSYSLGEGQTLGANLEASYDWNASQWSVPINFTYSKVFTAGTQPMSFSIGVRKYLVTADGGPDWGLRGGLTFLFPEK